MTGPSILTHQQLDEFNRRGILRIANLLTGTPGNAWFTDLRLLHTAVPNATDRPRMMATHRFVPADVMQELATVVGW